MRGSVDHMERYRITHPVLGRGERHWGFFVISDGPLAGLRMQSSRDDEWDHVSVSRPDRCPTWDEMCAIKELFFDDDECVMQLHVPKADHVNFHPYCLHLWKPRRGQRIPRPPAAYVGPVMETR